MRNHICESLLNACVNSHITDRQAKWTHSTDTSNLLNAFIDSSGVPYWAANLVVMEKCADHWLVCIADVSRSFLRPNLASHQFVVAETSKRSNGEERVTFKPHSIEGSITELVEGFINPYGREWDARLQMSHAEKTKAFFEYLYRQLIKNPDLLAGYAPEIRAWADAGIADCLSAGELKRIDAEIKQRAEDDARALAIAREQRAAEDAKRAKRAAAAEARKQRAKGGAA
jgi:hypothetical protein